MKTCSQCGFHLTDLDESCIRCGARLDAVGRADPRRLPRAPGKFGGGAFPRLRWSLPARLAAALRRRLYFLTRALASDLPEDVHYRNPWKAAFLAIIPGAGQLYNHQPKKALLLLAVIAATLALAVATLTHPHSNWILLGCLMLQVYGFHDALVTAKRINREFLPWQHKVAFYFVWFFYIAAFCVTFQYVATHCLLQFRHTSYNELSPFLRQGERYTVEMVSRPKVGDVVLYDPRKIRIEKTDELDNYGLNNVYTVDPSSMIERIVAGPGDTFERRDGIFYRNGRELPLEEEPLVVDYLPPTFKLTAPPNAYIILFSYTFGVDLIYALSSSPTQAPKLNAPNQIIHGWDESCVVYANEITGRLWFVYTPSTSRRFLR